MIKRWLKEKRVTKGVLKEGELLEKGYSVNYLDEHVKDSTRHLHPCRLFPDLFKRG